MNDTRMKTVVGTESTKQNLCDYCMLKFADCPTSKHIKFGDGVGNDNVIQCSEYVVRRFHHNFPIIAVKRVVEKR